MPVREETVTFSAIPCAGDFDLVACLKGNEAVRSIRRSASPQREAGSKKSLDVGLCSLAHPAPYKGPGPR